MSRTGTYRWDRPGRPCASSPRSEAAAPRRPYNARMDANTPTTSLTLVASRDEAGNVRTFVFETGGLVWTAGQSQAYVLPQAGDTEGDNERWFTIASAPGEGAIHISTRVSASRFKETLNALRPGDRILAHSLEGDFTWSTDSADPVVLVAGGIGITPFRSILIDRDRRRQPINGTLLYFNRTGDVPFQRELEAVAARHPGFTIRVLVGEAITADRILALEPAAATATTYLSGPEPMVETVGGDLTARGVTLKQDWFPGYDDTTY